MSALLLHILLCNGNPVARWQLLLLLLVVVTLLLELLLLLPLVVYRAACDVVFAAVPVLPLLLLLLLSPKHLLVVRERKGGRLQAGRCVYTPSSAKERRIYIYIQLRGQGTAKSTLRDSHK